MTEWYYSQNGVQEGPVAEVDFLEKIGRGEIARTELVWRDGMDDWKPLGQVAELRGTEPEGVGIPPVIPNQEMAADHLRVPAAKIPNYLWQSIAVTLLCCLPFGIVAIVYAARVESLAGKGDVDGAMKASASAKKWVNISVIAGLVILVFAGIGNLGQSM